MNRDTFRILAVLSTDPGTPRDVLVRCETVSPGDAPSLATFYRRLKEAVDRGWIEEDPGQPDASSPGRPARHFRITEAGLEAVRWEARRQRSFADLILPGEGAAG